jgi:hypothetical protein
LSPEESTGLGSGDGPEDGPGIVIDSLDHEIGEAHLTDVPEKVRTGPRSDNKEDHLLSGPTSGEGFQFGETGVRRCGGIAVTGLNQRQVTLVRGQDVVELGPCGEEPELSPGRAAAAEAEGRAKGPDGLRVVKENCDVHGKPLLDLLGAMAALGRGGLLQS